MDLWIFCSRPQGLEDFVVFHRKSWGFLFQHPKIFQWRSLQCLLTKKISWSFIKYLSSFDDHIVFQWTLMVFCFLPLRFSSIALFYSEDLVLFYIKNSWSSISKNSWSSVEDLVPLYWRPRAFLSTTSCFSIEDLALLYRRPRVFLLMTSCFFLDDLVIFYRRSRASWVWSLNSLLWKNSKSSFTDFTVGSPRVFQGRKSIWDP